MYPMSRLEFNYWLKILRREFPDTPLLKEAYKRWHPVGGIPALRHLPARLLLSLQERIRNM
jgi:hypothetical protein